MMKMLELFVIEMSEDVALSNGQLEDSRFLTLRNAVSGSTAMLKFHTVDDIHRFIDEVDKVRQKMEDEEYDNEL